MECYPIDYHPTLIRNILTIIWLQPKRCNRFNFPLIRGLIEKKCRFRVCPCLMTTVGTPNPFVMECLQTNYYCTLTRKILTIIWLQPKRCNSFNSPLIRGLIEKSKLQISRMSVFDDPRGYPLPICGGMPPHRLSLYTYEKHFNHHVVKTKKV